LAYSNRPELGDKNKNARVEGLIKLDASRLRTFANCPFQYFAQYDLSIEPRLTSRVTRLELGSFVHRVLEKCFRKWFSEREAIEVGDAKHLADEAVELARAEAETFRDGVFLRNPREQLLLETRIYPILKDFITQEIKRLAEIPLRPEYFEWRFGIEGKPGVKLQVPGNADIELTGALDRIDVGIPPNVDGAVALDYKLSYPKYGLPERMALGLETQIPVYIRAISELTGKRPLAGLFFYLEREKSKSPIDTMKNTFRRRGIYIKGAVPDEKLALGNIRTDGVEEEEFNEKLKASFEHLGDYARRLLDGDIDVKPYIYKKEKPCTSCDYRDLCRLDLAINHYRHPKVKE
jgi:ATP-dependent helicase/nuclease subunit B